MGDGLSANFLIVPMVLTIISFLILKKSKKINNVFILMLFTGSKVAENGYSQSLAFLAEPT